MGSDWCNLLPDLLRSIAEKITSLADYLRFRAVCRPWLNACSPRPRHLPLQLPWLMLPYQSDGNNNSTRLFYDLSDSKIHKLDLPETRGVSICGSSHGWLVLQKGQVVSLLNPITHATIPLPPFTAPPCNMGIAPCDASDPEHFFENFDDDRYAIKPTDHVIVSKAILTSSPLDPSCKLFVLIDSNWQLAFCKIGDKCWTVIEFESISPPWGADFCHFTYIDGFVYTVNPFLTVAMYNLNNNPSRTLLGGSIDLMGIHLVQGVSGDILLIYDRPGYGNGVMNETKHTVYKWSNPGEPNLIEVVDVGQNVLFLGGDYNAFSLSSANLQLPGWGANCLCYDSVRTEQWNRQDSSALWYNHKIKLARLDDGTVTDISGDLGSFQVNGLWQNSLWLTPSLL